MKRLACWFIDHKPCRPHGSKCPDGFHCTRCGLGMHQQATSMQLFEDLAVDGTNQVAIAHAGRKIRVTGRPYRLMRVFNASRVTRPFLGWKRARRTK